MPDFPWLDAGLLLAVVAIIAAMVFRRYRGHRREARREGPAERAGAARAALSQREGEHEARGQRRQRLWLAMRDSGLQELPGSLDEPMRALQRLHEMLGQAPDWEQRLPGGDVLEITDRAGQLYDLALGQVERAINLRDLARTVPAADASLPERLDELLADLNATLGTLAAALDQLHASAVAGGFDPAMRQRLREDLDARLRIAAAVERRMHELE